MKNVKFTYRPDLIVQKFAENEYATFSKLCIDAAKGKLVKYTAAQANEAILKKLREIAGLEEGFTSYDVTKAMKKTAVREAIFEVIEDTVEDTLISGWQDTPFFEQYVEFRSNRLGQTNRFYVPDQTEIIVSELSASNHNITRQRLGAGTEFGVTVKNYGAKVYMEAERYLMGVEDWSALIDKIAKAYTLLINTLLHDAVMSAGSTLPTPEQWNITCQMAAADRKKIVKLLSDVAIATGSIPVLMGTAVALEGLKDMGKIDYLPESAKEEIYRTGRIGQFDQYPLVEIPQAFARNDTSKYLVDDTRILVMPGNIDKFVKFYDEGDTQIKEVNDRNVNYDNTNEYELIRKFGAAVMTNVRFGNITIKA